jgi:hypothetical protein
MGRTGTQVDHLRWLDKGATKAKLGGACTASQLSIRSHDRATGGIASSFIPDLSRPRVSAATFDVSRRMMGRSFAVRDAQR